MSNFKKIFKHFKVICTHKFYVCKYCFKFGLYWQGFFHDISKFSIQEFLPSVKYFQGNKSPIDAEKEDNGYSLAWAHHHNRNPHHWLYWVDFDNKNEISPMRIPYKYVIEAFCDWIGAGIAYSKKGDKSFDWEEPYEYYKNNTRINSDKNIDFFTRQIWDIMLVDLKENGIDYVIQKHKNGIYKKYYNTPKDKEGNYTICDLKEYNDLVAKYYL